MSLVVILVNINFSQLDVIKTVTLYLLSIVTMMKSVYCHLLRKTESYQDFQFYVSLREKSMKLIFRVGVLDLNVTFSCDII